MRFDENYSQFDSAALLPKEWDDIIGNNSYLSREFLTFLERAVPCGQRYYVFYDACGNPDTIFTTYFDSAFDLGLLTDKRRITATTLIALSIWVKKPGIVFGKERAADALRFIRKMKGFKFIQCISSPKIRSGFVRATAAPACVLNVKWQSFEEYLGSLRSNYRYRYNKALKRSSGLSVRLLEDNSQFSEQLYALYQQVERAAKIKINVLPIEFFRGSFFKILVFEREGKAVGFIQLLENGDELIFEFVGFDYEVNAQCHTYHRMLLEIVRYGIEGGFRMIDFGQTADDTKLKLGCQYEYLNVYVHHKNPIKQLVLRLAAPFIDYKPLKNNFNVFKEDEGQ